MATEPELSPRPSEGGRYCIEYSAKQGWFRIESERMRGELQVHDFEVLFSGTREEVESMFSKMCAYTEESLNGLVAFAKFLELETGVHRAQIECCLGNIIAIEAKRSY